MIDRCFRVGEVRGESRHYVFDFLDFCAFPNLWKWTFNVADAFVCVGAGILMVWCICSFVQEIKKEKNKKLEAEEGSESDVESNGETVEAKEAAETQESKDTQENNEDTEK